MKFPKFLEDLDPGVFLHDNYRVVDFETTNNDKGSALAVNPSNRLVAYVCLDGKTGKNARKYYERDSGDYASLLSAVRDSRFIVAHNAKFELQWLYKLGLEPGSVLVWDTMLAEYVLAGNRKWDLSLEATAKRYGLSGKESIVSSMIKGGICPSIIPDKRLLDYCEQDVDLTYRVFLEQRKRIVDEGLLPVMYTRCLTTVVLSDIERKGMAIDKDAVRKEFDKTVKACKKVMGKLADITGGINPKSPKQVGEYLYDVLGFDEPIDYKGEIIRTPAGGRSTGETTILSLVPKNDKQREFLDAYKEFTPLKKRLETMTKLNECAQNEGILLARFNQCVTASHRLSSSGGFYKVQFQNIDRDLKKLFIPRFLGWRMGDSDAPQLEFRTAAEMGNDAVAKKDIRDKVDVHKNTAQVLLGKIGKAISKSERTDAKKDTFKPLYGGNSGTPEQKAYFKWFRKRYNGIFSTQTNWTYEVLAKKELRIPSGLKFYWPEVEVYDSGYIRFTTEIFNYPIQSFATADIIPITLVYLYYRLRGLQTFIVNTVHDSIISEVHPDEEQEWQDAACRAYTSDVFTYLDRVYGVKFSTPLGVSYNIGAYWGDGEEKLFELDGELFLNPTV